MVITLQPLLDIWLTVCFLMLISRSVIHLALDLAVVIIQVVADVVGLLSSHHCAYACDCLAVGPTLSCFGTCAKPTMPY